MSRDTPIKAEKDFTEILEAELPEIEILSKNDAKAAFEKLLVLEKQTRQASDLASSKKVLNRIVHLAKDTNDWKLLNEQLILLSKKHGQLKAAVASMVQEVSTFLDDTPNLDIKIQTIETIRTVTESKIFVEVERARVTRILAKIKESQGDIDTATELLCELQVETYGSMELQEKIEFILEQMELCVKRGDFNQAAILSRKILVRSFKDGKFEELKLRYYDLMIRIASHDSKYLDICQYYQAVYETESINTDETKWKLALTNIVFFIVLSPYDNLQSDLIHKISLDSNLDSLPLAKDIIKSFTTPELMRWPIIEKVYGEKLKQTEVFSLTGEKSKERWEDLRKRVIEHNLRVISKYYTRIRCSRLNTLLDLTEQEAESFISNLVTQGTIYAKINRPQRIISFAKPKDSNDVLNEWSSSITDLLNHIETIEHLITKEEMMNGIKPLKA